MAIHLSDVGMLGAASRGRGKSGSKGVQQRGRSAQSRMDAKIAESSMATPTTVTPTTIPAPSVTGSTTITVGPASMVAPPSVSPSASPAAAAAAAGSPLPETIQAPSSGTMPAAPVSSEFIEQFKRDIPLVEEDSLRAITRAAEKNEAVDIRIAFPGQPVAVRRLSADQVKAVVSMAFDDIMRRGNTRPSASAGTVTQSGDSGQKTSELAVPGAPPAPLMTPAQAAAAAGQSVAPSVMPTSMPLAPMPESSDGKFWMSLGVGALVIVGALAWMRSRKQTQEAALPEQVQGWFEAPKRKRRSRR